MRKKRAMPFTMKYNGVVERVKAVGWEDLVK